MSDALAFDANARTPVDPGDAVSGLQIAVVLTGISITLPLMYSAGELARALGLGAAVTAVLIGAAIIGLMAIPAAVVGARTRLSSYMIIEHSFGVLGARVINIGLGFFLLGWYAVTAELFGRTLFLAAADMTSLALPQTFYTVVSSALVTATTVFGFKAIDRLALFAVPFLLLSLFAVVAFALREMGLQELLEIPAAGGMNMATAISAVVGASIVGVVLAPDLTRYARSTRDCVTASTLGMGFGTAVAYLVAMAPVLVWGELEPMAYMLMLGFGGLALTVIVFATWTTNVTNLYSAALASRAAVPAGRYRSVVLLLGLVGTAMAIVGISERLIDFLVTLGVLVPPVAGIYLVDFFWFRRQDYSEAHREAMPALRLTAVLIALVAGLLAAWLFFGGASITGVGALDSLLLTVGLYGGVESLALWRQKSAVSA